MKKTILLGLAAASAVMFILPAAASANWGVTGSGVVAFTSTTSNVTLPAVGEPTITCEGFNTVEGWYGETGTGATGTTGNISLHLLKCHVVVFFITLPCSNTWTPSSGTISTSGTFHNVTITKGKRGILVTPNETVVHCESTKSITVSGNVIGEVTSPTAPCPVKTNFLGYSFTLTVGSQTHKTIDGDTITEYDLSAQTEGGSKVTAGLSAWGTNTFNQEVTIDCNTP